MRPHISRAAYAGSPFSIKDNTASEAYSNREMSRTLFPLVCGPRGAPAYVPHMDTPHNPVVIIICFHYSRLRHCLVVGKMGGLSGCPLVRTRSKFFASMPHHFVIGE